MKPTTNDLLGLVREQLASDQYHFPPIRNHYEAYRLILDEVVEYWQDVAKMQPAGIGDPSAANHDDMRHNLVQIAARCVRALYDLDSPSTESPAKNP